MKRRTREFEKPKFRGEFNQRVVKPRNQKGRRYRLKKMSQNLSMRSKDRTSLGVIL